MISFSFLKNIGIFIDAKPEQAGVYVAVVMIVLTIIGLFVKKESSTKKIFKQRSGNNSQNIQGEKINLKIEN